MSLTEGVAASAASRIWWINARTQFELFVSQLVIDECLAGDPDAAQDRFEELAGIPRLQVTDSARDLADALMDRKAIPASEPHDALHIGIAAAHGIEYLVTWNFNTLPMRRFAITSTGFAAIAATSLQLSAHRKRSRELPMTPLTPIEDIRAARHKLAAKFNNDLNAIVADLRRQESESEAEFVTRPSRTPKRTTNHAMHRSGEANPLEVRNLSSPPGDR